MTSGTTRPASAMRLRTSLSVPPCLLIVLEFRRPRLDGVVARLRGDVDQFDDRPRPAVLVAYGAGVKTKAITFVRRVRPRLVAPIASPPATPASTARRDRSVVIGIPSYAILCLLHEERGFRHKSRSETERDAGSRRIRRAQQLPKDEQHRWAGHVAKLCEDPPRRGDQLRRQAERFLHGGDDLRSAGMNGPAADVRQRQAVVAQPTLEPRAEVRRDQPGTRRDSDISNP